MSEVTVTLTGFVATEPRHVVSASGTSYTTFRTATTRRYFDRSSGEWRDGQTLWFTVKTWRDTARNVAQSLRKGDPVVAQGVLGVDEWTGSDGPRTSLVLEARSLGPDLSRGEARFVQVVHRPTVPAPGSTGSGDGDGRPAEQTLVVDRADGPGAAAPEESARDTTDDDDPWAAGLLDADGGGTEDAVPHEPEPAVAGA
ncbi:single-stranded DNA-binding protein [Luteimicrobium subarcticum]|uniref:Single-stranded DNA-binding protein n=1 Tax=Luteimicrobium subarcticum TaxID=620910 RepID=A0A2M8WU84_9MICO|nr:single-stranded DNA-binding protein [Luteimicrobium subarcticum]PJI94505.1 single-strand DNA-binding protein [Luteimicrobium subarcticum]